MEELRIRSRNRRIKYREKNPFFSLEAYRYGIRVQTEWKANGVLTWVLSLPLRWRVTCSGLKRLNLVSG